MSTPEPFDVCGPLPSGVTVLEASAGTGKTFTIAALAARFVAEGTPLERLLIVTFTRMATSELRERVRDRLVSAERGLAGVLSGLAVPADDAVLALLADATPEVVEQRRRRLAAAVANFDAATISTTHGFCQHVLQGLGVAGDVEDGAELVEDVADLVEEVVDDRYVRRFHAGGTPPFDRAEALRIGRAVMQHPGAAIAPVDQSSEAQRLRRALAVTVRAEVERRKRRAWVLTYDDLLTRLRDTLTDPEQGPQACGRLRERYEVVLIDEFQDTDPVQWEIVRRAFADAGPDEPGGATTALVLIGDPKQAVYAFRGADVHAYLDAARSATSRATLGVNWRSDQALLDAYDALLAGTRLGHPEIAYRQVRAAEAHQGSRLVGAPVPAPLRLRILHRDDGLVPTTPTIGATRKPDATRHVAADLASDVVRLVSSGARIPALADDDHEDGEKVVDPGDVAVLVRTHRQAGIVRDALDAVGVPAVIAGAGSVFATDAAEHWLTLLEAIEQPSSPSRVRAAALTPFIGWTAEQVAAAGDDEWEAVHARMHRWADVLRRRGVASLVESMTRGERLPRRLLAADDGERQLTDLRHVGQLLHAEATTDQLGTTALTGWLRQRIRRAGTEAGAEERSRRLESDADAVQVLTIHRCKGLEFPIVYVPFLWELDFFREDDPAVYHDADAGGARTIDVAMDGSDFRHHQQAQRSEDRGEALRLAYVALTRARHQAVLWWVTAQDCAHSPLARLLLNRDADGTVAPFARRRLVDEDQVVQQVHALGAAVSDRISVERTTEPAGVRWAAGTATTPRLDVAAFGRGVDLRWRRASYSGITTAAPHPLVASEPEGSGTTDEPDIAMTIASQAAPSPADADAVARATPSPWATVPGGAAVGSSIHGVLERADFTAPDLDAELTGLLQVERGRGRAMLGDPATAVAGLRAAIETPLGPLVGDRRLRDLGRADRLDELSFELPLVGGDDPSGTLALRAIAAVLRDHLPEEHALAGYPDRLEELTLRHELRGYLTGSIDVVLRVGKPGHDRFFVVDYKTNWLGAEGDDLTAWHYRPAALVEAMQRSHYVLQALLYSVALHRFLRWRMADYRPDRHLGGILYLFLRGMTGADVPRIDGQPSGVFSWAVPPGLVMELSDLFDHGGKP